MKNIYYSGLSPTDLLLQKTNHNFRIKQFQNINQINETNNKSYLDSQQKKKK